MTVACVPSTDKPAPQKLEGGRTMFTFADYKKALKGAGPKLKENILWRAREDPNIGFPEYVMLEDMAYPGI